jgi:uracil-DNA glycosylase family 4
MVTRVLLEKISLCTKCESITEHEKFHSQTHGNLNADYILVSEAPARGSLDNKKYWTGQSGQILRSCLRGLNIELEELFYLTDIVKCWTSSNGKNREPIEKEIQNCGHFLFKEILELEPKLILSFGKIVSSYLLKRSVSIKEEHGKIYTIRNKFKVLVLLHPSNIDFFMKRDIYKSQISNLFNALHERRLNDIPKIFAAGNTLDKPKIIKKSENFFFQSFIIPSGGNMITEGDIKGGRLRITVEFKDYFPKSDCRLLVVIKEENYDASFTYNVGRSHVLRIGKRAMEQLGVEKGGEVRFRKIAEDTYELDTYKKA